MFSEEDFIRLVEAVEAQGGELLNKTHVSRPITYKIPGNHGRVKTEHVASTGCGQEMLFSVPYDVDKGDVVEVGSVEMCAICDLMPFMPRFAQAMST